MAKSHKLRNAAIVLFVLVLAAFGTWYGYHAWPRPMPAPLYPLNLFDVPQPAADNALAEYQKIADSKKSIPIFSDDHSELLQLYTLPDLFTKRSMDDYWDNAAKLLPALQDFLKIPDLRLQELQRIREMPVMVDETLPKMEKQAIPVVTIIDIHRVFQAMLVEQMLDGKIDAAYASWRKQYVQDLSWVKSARSLISVIAALTALSSDLGMLRLMIDFHPPENRADWIQWLRLHPMEGGDYKRPLKFDYLKTLTTLDFISANRQQAGFFGKIGVLNPAVMRTQYNDYFGQIEKILVMPLADQPQAFDALQAKFAPHRGRFWWVRNPAENYMILTRSYQIKYFSDITLSRDVILTLQREIILALQTEPPPDSQPSIPSDGDENNSNAAVASPTPRPTPVPQAPPPLPHPSPTPLVHEE